MDAGHVLVLAGPKQLAPAQDQHPCFQTYLTRICRFFQQGILQNNHTGIIQNACYCLFSTDLNNIFHIIDVSM